MATALDHTLNEPDRLQMENRYQLVLNISMSARYHQLAEKWYTRLNDFGTLLSLLAGSAVFAGLLRDSQMLTTIAAGLVTIFAGINLVVGTARKATAQREQYRRFCDLEAKAHEIASDDELHAEIKKIERDDGPILPGLLWAAYYQNLLRWGQDPAHAANAKRELSLWQRFQLLLI